ncbi:acidic amino acid decarboxylase GADL1 isoform X2 [Cephus cinctus]|uniref:Acidic amino acid decarboxylase GADL1 isoform X2 n=1 Tax=Cephus cinctus TaxID=211228 RepID=A0AAJ7VWT6_CEPCN|nr:acidic amino acid decarboxylase GADL1 isoform X2 [Cephus cinctus]
MLITSVAFEQLPIRLKDEGTSLKEIEKILQSIVRYSVKTSSPHFHNQLYGAVDEYGIAGAWLTEALNTSQYTYEVAPVFTLLEREVIERSLELIGFPKVPEGDGIFCPGGSMSNMYGMVLARYAVKPDVKTKGLFGIQPLACFTSEAGHYSITKGAHWLGLGTESIYQVKTDEWGRMDPQELKKAIAKSRENGRLPFFVNATAGTTVLGSFDPLPEISAICKAEGLWLHVDMCLGGTLLLSRKYRTRLEGIALTNSVAWNPHKTLGAPFQCSLFLVKGKDILHKANSAGATYLFQQDKFYDVSWDTGDKSVQCGRKVDAAKFWLMWKARGSKGFESLINKAMETAEYFFNKIKNRKGFRLVLPKFEGNVVCFWYIPPSMRGLEETEEWKKKLHTIAPKIKEKMILDGSIMIGYTPLGFKSYGNFLRMVVTCQPPASHSAMNFAIEQIEKFGADL